MAPGDSQRRARPARANLASEEAGAQIGPDLHFFLMLGTFLLFISQLFLLGLGDIFENFSVFEVLWSLVGGTFRKFLGYFRKFSSKTFCLSEWACPLADRPLVVRLTADAGVSPPDSDQRVSPPDVLTHLSL